MKELQGPINVFLKSSAYIDIALIVLLVLFQQLNQSNATAIIIGLTLSWVNFIWLSLTINKAFQGSVYDAQKKIMKSYGLRMLLTLLILGIAISSENINQWFIVIHLFYAKIIFTVRALLGKEE